MSTGALALVGPRVEPPLGGGGADGRYEVMVVVDEVVLMVGMR